MRKKVLLLTIAVFVCQLCALPLTTISETNNGYSAEIEIPQLVRSIKTVSETALNGTAVIESFEKLSLEGYGLASPFGAPNLPSGVLDIAYEGDVPTFTISNVVADTIQLDYRVYPSQPIPSYSLTKPLAFEINETAYQNQNRSSYELVQIGDIYKIRNQKGVQFVVSPLNYDANGRKIIVVKSFTLNIKTDKVTQVRSGNASTFDKLIRATFENIQGARSVRSGGKEKYLIIAADRFVDNEDLLRFVAFRERTHDVELVSLSDIGGGSKSSLHSKIDATAPAYLVFVGEYSDFPSYDGTDMASVTQGQMQGKIKSYLKYIDGGDNRPDISLGLFFVRDNVSLKNLVDKTINNQQNLADMGDGYLCFAGHNRYGQQPMTATHIDEIFTDFERQYWSPMGFDLTKVYAAGSPNKSDCRKVVSTLNEGLRFLNYNGHGLEMGWNYTQSPQNDIWGEGYFSQAGQSYQLEAFGAINNTINPFVISCACLTGQFKNNGPSWAETWIGHKNLATAFIGASEISFGNQHCMNAYMMEAIKDHEITTFGDMFTFAITQTFGTNKFSNFQASSYAQIGAEEYHYFGDPAVETMELDIDPFITVTAPNGGDTLAIGEATTITWSSNCESEVTIKLCGDAEMVIANATDNDGELIWVIPETLENGSYTIKISCATASDESDESFVIKKIPVSDEMVEAGDWSVSADSLTGTHASNAELDDTHGPECVCGTFSIGESDETNDIWPWASLTCSPGNDLDGVSAIKVKYMATKQVKITLDNPDLNESGAQYGYVIPATSSYREILIPCDSFAQPEWTLTADKDKLQLSNIRSISFNPFEAYGDNAEISIKGLRLYNFKGKEVAVTEGETVIKAKSLAINSINSNTLNLSIKSAGNYKITLYSLTGKILFSESRNLSAGQHAVSLATRNLASQVSIVSIKGAGESITAKQYIR